MNIAYFFTKQATLTRRSTVLSLALQLEFPGSGIAVLLGSNFIKLFTGVNYQCEEEARMFAVGKPFQPCLMFVGKARSLPYCGAPERLD